MVLTAGMLLVLDNHLHISLRKSFDDFSLEVDETLPLDGCLAVFGPSGAGKSTLLRLLAGFEKPDQGQIICDQAVWADKEKRVFLPPHQRGVGYMFQDGRLFPHLTVEKNLHYADSRSQQEEDPFSREQIIEAFDLSPLLGRQPASLSGGERQRVALARTLLTRPSLLLLDEPLAALDHQRKAEILPYLETLLSHYGLPAIYVSHQIDEVIRLADQTLLLEAGTVTATGPTVDILQTHHGEGGEELGAVLTGRITAHDEVQQLTKVAVGEVVFSLPMARQKELGDEVRLHIAARSIAIATSTPEGLSIRNILPAEITLLSPQPSSPFVMVVMKAGDDVLRAQVTKDAVDELKLAKGKQVYALIKTASFTF